MVNRSAAWGLQVTMSPAKGHAPKGLQKLAGCFSARIPVKGIRHQKKFNVRSIPDGRFVGRSLVGLLPEAERIDPGVGCWDLKRTAQTPRPLQTSPMAV